MLDEKLRSNSNRLIAVQLARAARSAWIVVVPATLLFERSSGTWRLALGCFLLYYLSTRVHFVLSERLGVRYACSERGMVIERGVIFRRTSRTRWDDVRAVTTNATLLLRLVGCRSVTVVGPDGNREFVLSAIRADEANRIEALATVRMKNRTAAESHSPPQASPSPPHFDRAADRQLTVPLTIRDHFIIGFAGGSLLLAVPAVASAAQWISRREGLSLTPTSFVRAMADLSAVELTLIAGSMCAVGLAYGTFLSWLKFRGFAVSSNGRTLVFEGGLVNAERRTLEAERIDVVVIRENVAMRMTGRAQFRCVVGGADDSVLRSMLLPLVRIGDGYATLQRLAPDLSPSSAPELADTRGAAARLDAAALFAVAACGCAVASAGGAPLLISVGVAAAVALATLDRQTGGLALDRPGGSESVVVRIGTLRRTTWILRLDAIQSVTIRRGPVGSLLGSTRVTIRYRDRFTKRLVRRAVPAGTASDLAARLGRSRHERSSPGP